MSESTVEQGTVSRFDPATSSGAVLRDDGSEVRFGAEAFSRGGMRQLNRGQRVRMRIVDGEVVAVTILTFGLPG